METVPVRAVHVASRLTLLRLFIESRGKSKKEVLSTKNGFVFSFALLLGKFSRSRDQFSGMSF